MSLRTTLTEKLKAAMLGKQERATATIRMAMAALKQKDIDARSAGNMDGIPEEQILSLLQNLIKQRRESIVLYQQGGRPELAAQEQEEITVLEQFLPVQLDDAGVDAAITSIIATTGASSIKDMGKVMAALKAQYSGQMDFAQASAKIKEKLAG